MAQEHFFRQNYVSDHRQCSILEIMKTIMNNIFIERNNLNYEHFDVLILVCDRGRSDEIFL
jgi:hypothetical protein